MRTGVWITVVAALSGTARADSKLRVALSEPPSIIERALEPVAPSPTRPWTLDVMLASRLTLTAGADITSQSELGVSRRFQDRWHLGLRAELELGPHQLVTSQLVETGVLLHGSSQVDVLLGLRIGHAYVDYGKAIVHGLVLETVAQLSYRLSVTGELHFAPFVFTARDTGLWQVTVGPELGLAWRL